MNHTTLIDDYLAGPKKLRDAIGGMTDEQIDAAPIPGKRPTIWSMLRLRWRFSNEPDRAPLEIGESLAG